MSNTEVKSSNSKTRSFAKINMFNDGKSGAPSDKGAQNGRPSIGEKSIGLSDNISDFNVSNN